MVVSSPLGVVTQRARYHRRTVGRVIPWRGARQQSPPPFHPTCGMYLGEGPRARARRTLARCYVVGVPVRKTGLGVAKDRSFFVQGMGSTSKNPRSVLLNFSHLVRDTPTFGSSQMDVKTEGSHTTHLDINYNQLARLVETDG